LTGRTKKNLRQRESGRIIGAENVEVSSLPEKRAKRVIVEDKYVDELTIGMIRATEEKYHYPYFPNVLEMHIPFKTEVSEDVKEYAREKGVRIVRVPMYSGKAKREV
jgi:hypothetical protein